MHYTTKEVDQLAKSVGLPVYDDYAFLFRLVQGSSKKISLAKKRADLTNKFFGKLHADFVQQTINKQYHALPANLQTDTASSITYEDELMLSL